MQRQIQQRRNIVDGSSGNNDIMEGFFANKIRSPKELKVES